MHAIERFESDYLKKGKDVPQFEVGDMVKVHHKIVEGDKERTQIFQGVVIRIKGRGVNKTFAVRKTSFGVGVEKTYPVHSPRVARVQVVRHNKVRRAKLYYLRALSGKSARLKERISVSDKRKKKGNKA